MPGVITGIEKAKTDQFAFLNGSRLGVLANQASVDPFGKHLVDLLLQYVGGELTTLFAPEHGFEGKAQDMVPVSDEMHAADLHVKSLYGSSTESLTPRLEDFKGLDVLLVDLPDIGTRYYTYSQTLAYCMEVAGKAGVKVIVLDRPNPIGGTQTEGSHLKNPFRSFCGIGPIANRHGFTLGELAKLFQTGFGQGEDAIHPHSCDLEVIPTKGWNRSEYLDETDIPWIRPSPNMPSLDTAIIYPGACLFEATNLSEGRGTDHPFEWIGAPYIDPEAWIAATLETGIPVEGVSLSPVHFTPAFQKHAGETCHGIEIKITDRNHLQPYRLGLALLIAAAKMFPDSFRWRDKAYEFIADIPAIDLLYGSDTLRRVIEKQEPVEQLLEEIESFESWYTSAREAFLCY